VLGGPFTYVADRSLTGQNVSLVLAGAQLTVTGPTKGPHVPVPASSIPTTTTTVPSDVITNTQHEPWNPVPCTPGTSVHAAGQSPAPAHTKK
jgi:hypothetical protein